ncbi:MAG: Hsp20/alpha crystallin family protein [Acidobacteria bacterium]|nr:Hsp20/alpha crystallin family protein [Acidobacteriota bacterium]
MGRKQDYFWLLSNHGRLAAESCWTPAADIYRTRGGWLVKIEVAGVQPDDVDVEVSGRSLFVRGVRRDHDTSQAVECYQMELVYSHFERKIELPRDVLGDEIDCEFVNGLLLVKLLDL